MKLQDDIEFTSLGWIKHELDSTLRQAQEALEAYVDTPADSSLMRICGGHLHQVQGTLRMIELYGAALVVEEMEQLVKALLDDAIGERDEAYSVLMRGIVQLPDYLERLQGGHKDIPIVLLPLLNDLRACRGEKLLSESALFAPDMAVELPAGAAGAAQPLPVEQQRQAASRLRLAYQASLLRWFRGEDEAAALQRLIGVLDRLRELSSRVEPRRLWWVAAAVVEALQDRALDVGVTLKLLFGRIDLEIKRFAEGGEEALHARPPRDLLQNLLYYVANSGGRGGRVSEVRATYQLDGLLPSAREVEHAQGAMTGHNRNLLDTVSAAIKDDLLRVKEVLDIFLRTHSPDPETLGAQTEILDRVGDTLGMLGLGVPRRVVGEQRQIIDEIASGKRPVDESSLLDVAGALLYVEASLDDHIERLGAGGPGDEDAAEGKELPRAEVRKILDALMREAAINIQQAKHDIVAFIESPWDHSRVELIPRLLEEIAGALRMLGLEAAAELMPGVVRFVEIELIRHRRIPTVEQMDKLADALASIEYYLEATREQRSGRECILDVTRESLASLGYWPVPPALEEAAAPEAAIEAAATPVEPPTAFAAEPVWTFDAPGVADASVEPASVEPAAVDLPSVELDTAVEIAPGDDLRDLILGGTHSPEPHRHEMAGLRLADTGSAPPADEQTWIEIEEEIEEELPGVEPLALGFQSAASDDIDDDIREVFLDEVQDEVDSLQRVLPGWSAQLGDLDAVKTIRRSFHTLKGSGRLVGALTLGEFSWKIENMLNRVLDRTIEPSRAVFALTQSAISTLPDLLAALRGERAAAVDLGGIMETADRLAAGEDAWLPPAAARRTVKRVVRRRVPAVWPHAEADRIDADTPETIAVATAASGPAIDPVLYEILRNETDTHLATVEAWLESGDALRPGVEDPVQRAVHTLHGAIAMVDIPALTAVLAPLEGYLKRLGAQSAALPPAGRSALGDACRVTRDVIARIGVGDLSVPDTADLAERLTALRDALPEPGFDLLRAGLDEEAVEPAALDENAEAADTVSADEIDAEPAETDRSDANLVDADDTLTDETADATADATAPPGPRERAADLDTTGAELEDFTDILIARYTDAGTETNETAAAPAAASSPLEALFAGVPTTTPPAEPPADVGEGADPLADEIEWLLAESAAAPALGDEADDDATEPTEIELSSDDMAWLSELDADTTPAVASDDAASAADAAEAPAEAPAFEPYRLPTFDVDEPVAEVEVEVEAGTTEPTATEAAIEEDAEPQPATASAAEPAPAIASPATRWWDAERETPPIPDDPLPEGALALDDADEDLLEIFVQEASDILDHSDSLVARLHETPEAFDLLSGLQRDLHTLKGGARMAGLTPIGDLSHAMESLLEAIHAGSRRMDRAAIESFERGFDRLHGLVQRVGQRQAIAMPQHAIARFEQLVEGRTLDAAADGARTPQPDAAPAQPTAAAAPGAPATTAAAFAPAAGADDDETMRASQEMIRVRSELVDSLVNYAGEVSIYRSRLEQQIASFRFNLVEFEQTVNRLREQLRKLEIETEAQIIARYQRENEESGAATFDPLELDRFSQLQQYSRALGESVSDLVSIQGVFDELTRQSETLLLQQSRVSSDLHEGLMRTRMVTFDSLVPTLRRTLRQAAQELGKRAQLRVEGAQGEMDRNLLERMKAPFEHMLRNALAHGIEPTEQRLAAGKPAEGTVNIALSREATEVVLKVSDDGRGLDLAAIRRRAIERGLLKADAQLSDRDLQGFILESGFSTTDQITQLAGRGVGMDVVASEIKQLGGTLGIDSQAGRGTAFTVRLPFTLAVTQAILVKLGEATYAIPMSSVQGVVRIDREELRERLLAGNTRYAFGGEDFHFHDLSQLLGVPGGRNLDETQLPLLMTRTGDQRAAIRVDAVIGSREVVVKSVGPQISSIPGIFGATIMGDGSVVMILDLAPLVRRAAALREDQGADGGTILPDLMIPEAQAEVRQQPLVMVVDDSITMRKVTTRVLERASLEVVTAKDGLDAVEKLQDRVPDLMLLDIEMPRMDGYELATYMRNDVRLREVPIIMITSRTGEKHRQRALELGVQRYLGKPYQEADLMQNVVEVLGLEP
ncbi:MAG: hybrid sensor histidine kinase/response regulator [Rhodanobacter denitrificans]|uniref:Chemotaxis protein CheA n=1 Tax=Rhodanobacter denitrificans TaxID=666685 RepID=A0A2W5MGC5_9GAMM|nr:MAG: hybrid sensor histidine kinase/response regulator [Rhodanobacter denitrificans]